MNQRTYDNQYDGQYDYCPNLASIFRFEKLLQGGHDDTHSVGGVVHILLQVFEEILLLAQLCLNSAGNNMQPIK